MMQMMDVRGGRVVIDDTDVATLDGESLRGHLNVVPQEPVFMPGSLRFNLDPRGVASDASIEAMLRRVSARLWDKLATGSNGSLHDEFKSSQWSHGEQQLFCLTRALLIPSMVIIFDEAMSRYDPFEVPPSLHFPNLLTNMWNLASMRRQKLSCSTLLRLSSMIEQSYLSFIDIRTLIGLTVLRFCEREE